MAKRYYEKDGNLASLKGRTVAIIGYGSQGHAHALNLRDSGVDVVVGLYRGSKSWDKAEAAGLNVMTVADAAKAANVVMILVSDHLQADLYTNEIGPHMTAGKTLMFAHGFSIHFKQIVPPPDVDVSMIAPKAPGHRVRELFTEGVGVPALVAIDQNPSGQALERALAYALALGCLKAGVIETTFREETESDLFGEQSVLCGGVSELIRAGFETLVEAGYAPEIAYFECLHELKLIVDLIQEGGLSYMRFSVSDTAEYGDYTRGPRVVNEQTRAEMRKILAEVQSGAFAQQWIEENKTGRKKFLAMREAARDQKIEQVGRELREMMTFLKKKKEVGVPEEQPALAARKMKIFTFDTTLRDGTQGESVSFSVDDKLVITQKLDELGIDYIEGGWPGSNPKDKEFFERAKDLKLHHARLAAFGATRFAKNPVDQDRNVLSLLGADTPVVSIFGKSWELHTRRALSITEEENLKLISETVRFLKDHGKEVVYDAEHFFDGYHASPAFALRTLEAAQKAGADVLVLCDTNGGTLTGRLIEIIVEVRKRFDGVLGIHTHNDSDVAVANAIAAIEQGCTHVQGCMNGYGERCGNANLCSIIANLELKLGHTTIGPEKLSGLTAAASFIAELANLPLRGDQPFVGHSAFAHKGGVHVSAVLKDSATYEHIQPEAVGNRQRVLVSDLSGRGNVLYKLKQHGLADRLSEDARRELLERIKEMEYLGHELEAAEGTFELLVREALHPGLHFFDVEGYEVTTKSNGSVGSRSTATVNLRAQDGVHSATASGQGPVHALDLCLRKCLSALYPRISEVRLTDYKVRVLEPRKGTAARVRVLVEWSDHRKSWSTVGVSDNVIEASWSALVDAIRLELMRFTEQDESVERAVEDYCWGV